MVDLDNCKSCILSGLEDCIDNFCSKHEICKSMSGLINKLKGKVNTRTGILNNTLHKLKLENSFNSRETKKDLESLHNRPVVVPIDKATGNIALICKQFYTSVIAKEVRLGLNNRTYITVK